MGKYTKPLSPPRERLYEIIFEADTIWGRRFDIGLMVVIVASVLVVMMETVESNSVNYKYIFFVFEWIFTIFFTIEYDSQRYVNKYIYINFGHTLERCKSTIKIVKDDGVCNMHILTA